MRGLVLGLTLSIAFVLGCVTAPSIVRPLRAQQSTQDEFRECVMYTLHFDAQADDLPGNAKQVPPGWTPVGGWHHGVVLCR